MDEVEKLKRLIAQPVEAPQEDQAAIAGAINRVMVEYLYRTTPGPDRIVDYNQLNSAMLWGIYSFYIGAVGDQPRRLQDAALGDFLAQAGMMVQAAKQEFRK